MAGEAEVRVRDELWGEVRVDTRAPSKRDGREDRGNRDGGSLFVY